MEKEEWKDIVGFEGYYQVSNKGNVKSLERKALCCGGAFRIVPAKILKPTKDKDGYLQVMLSKNNEQKSLKVHRLVAQAFLPNENNLIEVNHKDECRSNNTVDNLEWCDRIYNINYGTRKQKLRSIQKNRNDCSRQIICLELEKIFPSIMEGERWINKKGAHMNIISCCLGKTKTAYGYHWKYIEEKKKVDFSIF